MPSLVWIPAAIAVTAIVGLTAVLLWWRSSRRPGLHLPQDWPLMQRPVFSWEERALYRQLRAALPNHIILAKLPLVRFCQPIERQDLRYWFELLGPIHVSFVVCASGGRALAAIDIDKTERRSSERTLAIKQAVLEACHIRYVKCRADQLPSIAELQLLVPSQGDLARPQMPGPFAEQDARSTLAHSLRNPRRAAPAGVQHWPESGFGSDSFFAPESREDRISEFPQHSLPVGEAPLPARPGVAPRGGSRFEETQPPASPRVAAPGSTLPFPATERPEAIDAARRDNLRRSLRDELRLEMPTPPRRAPEPPILSEPPTARGDSAAQGSTPGEFGPNITRLHRDQPAGGPARPGSGADVDQRLGRH